MAQHIPDKIDLLIGKTMAQAPDVLHHIFALEGANEVLIALNTEAGKVAYLVHAIAVELYNADKSIDSTAGLTLLTLAKDHC
ncbi:hypothetical protein ABVK25_008387 [Lepraria finkii]|uniref:Uncharacterized protein n=1 Tax=Lepraria finkii TaxID=1340010 RepID=A0ABR4B0B5_9LECA